MKQYNIGGDIYVAYSDPMATSLQGDVDTALQQLCKAGALPGDYTDYHSKIYINLTTGDFAFKEDLDKAINDSMILKDGKLELIEIVKLFAYYS